MFNDKIEYLTRTLNGYKEEEEMKGLLDRGKERQALLHVTWHCSMLYGIVT